MADSPAQNNNKQAPKGKKGGMPRFPRGEGFWMNFATTLLLFLLLASAYSFFAGDSTKEPEGQVTLSQLAQDITGGKVSSIIVSGDDLTVTYGDESVKESKKEAGTALTDTLVNYGVAPAALTSVSIDIKRESGWKYWLAALAPFLGPLLLIGFFVWFL